MLSICIKIKYCVFHFVELLKSLEWNFLKDAEIARSFHKDSSPAVKSLLIFDCVSLDSYFSTAMWTAMTCQATNLDQYFQMLKFK